MKYLIALLLTLTSLTAAEVETAPDAQLFRAGEFNLDLYGVGTLGNSSRNPDDVNLGGGIGGTYWITRGLGIGGRAESEDSRHSVVDRGIVRLSVRAPLWDHVAPYGYLDGAFDFERNGWQAGAGGGLELRIVHGWGIFGEAGLQVDTDGEGQMRGAAGVRLTF